MASNLRRVISSTATATATALEPSKQLGLLTSASIKRFICSDQTQQPIAAAAAKAVDDDEANDGDRESEEADEDDEDSLDINKETGEIGGPKGPEPTRFGDWEKNGRCSDF